MFLNIYGDRKLETTGTHGADIAAQRIDDLDVASLEYIQENKALLNGVALDFGSGAGYHTLRMASLGVKAISVDLLDLIPRYDLLKDAFSAIQIEHVCARIEKFAVAENKVLVSLLYSQRTFHYLPFAESVRILRELHSWSNEGAKAFLSVSGLDSELGQGYPDKQNVVAERWSPLNQSMAQKHGILEPVCLYREEDIALLAEQAGYTVNRLWSSVFGNVKAVLERE